MESGGRRGTVIAVAIVALAAGYGQFGAVAALGEVAKTFGHPIHGGSLVEQAGLSGTVLGVGLATLRLASVFGLPLAAAADRLGRRGTLIWWTILGLAATMAAATSPSYWWFVAIFALGRPLLSAAAALAQVVTAEISRPSRRAGALAFVSAGYGLGAGVNALTHSALRGIAGFRILFLTSMIPLVIVIFVAKLIPEPVRSSEADDVVKPRFAMVGPGLGLRLTTVMGLILATSIISAPASSFVYLYAENVTHLAKGVESAMIVSAALVGLFGLMLGRRVADDIGRRPAIAIGVSGIAGGTLVTYSGGRPAVVIGFLLGVLATGFLAPAGTAFPNELFPTSVRASVAGWGIVAGVAGAVIGLILFGTIADRTGSFFIAAGITALAAVFSLLLVIRLPETRGTELVGTLGSDGALGKRE